MAVFSGLAGVAVFPISLIIFLLLAKSDFVKQAGVRLIILCSVGLLFHHETSPALIASDGTFYLSAASLIHNGDWGFSEIVSEHKALWPALIAPLKYLDVVDFSALVIGLSATLVTIASLEILKLGRAFSMRGATVLEPLVFSLSLPVMVFGPSPLRESLFWFSLVLIGTGAYELVNRGFQWAASWKILVGAVFVSVARVEMGAISVVWVFVLVLVVSATAHDWRIRLYQVMLFVVTALSTLFFVVIVFGGGVPDLQEAVTDIQTAGTAASSYPQNPEQHFWQFLALSVLNFFLGLFSPGAGFMFNVFALFSWASWFLVLVGVASVFFFGGREFLRGKWLVYLVGPAILGALLVMMVDNLGTLIRLKVAVVALLVPLALQGWSYFFTFADERNMRNISDSIVTGGKWGALKQLFSASDGRGSESSAI